MGEKGVKNDTQVLTLSKWKDDLVLSFDGETCEEGFGKLRLFGHDKPAIFIRHH